MFTQQSKSINGVFLVGHKIVPNLEGFSKTKGVYAVSFLTQEQDKYEERNVLFKDEVVQPPLAHINNDSLWLLSL